MKRVLDVCCSSAGLLILAPLISVIGLAIRLTSRGPALYWSKRIGRDNLIFSMPKFRTMYFDTPQLATHLLQDSSRHVTSLGRFLRKTSLDELPQLWSVLVGQMSLVGPRPALFNQDDLVALRTARGVHRLTPGITGWAQINGRDELEIAEKVEFDEAYLHRRSFLFDLKILLLTVVKVFRRDGIRQADEASHGKHADSVSRPRAA